MSRSPDSPKNGVEVIKKLERFPIFILLKLRFFCTNLEYKEYVYPPVSCITR